MRCRALGVLYCANAQVNNRASFLWLPRHRLSADADRPGRPTRLAQPGGLADVARTRVPDLGDVNERAEQAATDFAGVLRLLTPARQ